MSDLKIYIVTLKSYDDLESFYEDMENPGGNLYIPNRSVEVAELRPISRNTHYYLTDEEAQQLILDPRVLAVELQSDYAGFKPSPAYTQTSQLWDKSSLNSVDPTLGVRNNWGLLRLFNGQQIPNWGIDANPAEAGTINVNQAGYNVDIVVVDGIIDPTLSELAVNSDGTGGSRVIQYNWLSTVGGNYSYSLNPALSDDNNHGAHVAGIVAGNSQGWARGANIYNISPYDSQILPDTIFDYIRIWHNSKPVNPLTGRKNPTIVNNSWLFRTSPIPYSNIVSLTYRGTTVFGPFVQSTDLNQYGLFPDGSGNLIVPARLTSVDVDIQDCIDNGIIVIGASGNESMLMDVLGGTDYNNSFTLSGYLPVFYSRGGSPTASATAVAVGAIDVSSTEGKAIYSNCGPRVSVFAPGSRIMSCVNNNQSGYSGAVADPRGSGYLYKNSGTSMASPQVAGIIACLLQVYSNLTQSKVNEYIQAIGKTGQIFDPAPNSPSNKSSLQDGPNRYCAFVNERNDSGNIYPQTSYWLRPTSGPVWPRTNLRKTP